MNQRKFIKPINLIMSVLNKNIKATFKIPIEVHNMKSIWIYLRQNNYKYLILNMNLKRVIFGWKVVRNSLKCQKLSEKVSESISKSEVFALDVEELDITKLEDVKNYILDFNCGH